MARRRGQSGALPRTVVMSIPPDWASRFIGIPYTDHGRTRAGTDCWGLLRLVMVEQFGRDDVPEYANVEMRCDDDRQRVSSFMRDHVDELWRKIDPDEVEPGDCILFNLLGVPIHVGVICAPGLFIHCQRGCNSCVERYHSGPWKPRIEGFYRLRKRHLPPQDVP